MMKKIWCLLTFLIVGLVTVLCATNSYAAEVGSRDDIVTPQYAVISSTKISLSLTDTGVQCNAAVLTQRRADISIKMYLQKKSGTTWNNVKIWEESAANSVSLILKKNYAVSKGTFRVKAVMNADGEIQTVISSSKSK